MNAMLRLLLGTAILPVATLSIFGQEPSAFHLTGTVINASTQAPVPRCHLSIRPEADPRASQLHRPGRNRSAPPADTTLTADTDQQGRFSFDVPSSGRWQLSASAPGYRTQSYNEHEEFSSAIVLSSSAPVPALLFHLQPDSSISGYVRDEAGDPVRNASVSVQPVRSIATLLSGRPQMTQTDDRGFFELSDIPPGNYHLTAQAIPWYATGGLGRSTPLSGSRLPVTDAALDVVYPLTWYPGVLDAATATQLSLHDGESLHLDFNLSPIPAAHLRLPVVDPGLGTPRPYPMVERADTNVPVNISGPHPGSHGESEVDSLPPGLYRISTPSLGGGTDKPAISYVQVQPGASVAYRPADLSSTADAAFLLTGDSESSSASVTLTDLKSGQTFSSDSQRLFGFRRRFLPEAAAPHAPDVPERHVVVPPGQYLVTLSGDADLYLTNLTLKTGPVSGRVLTLDAGTTAVTLSVARGRASVTGKVTVSGHTLEGAMVMLIPTSLGQAGALELLRRDQTNTDGSFDLLEVIPGDYILLAIDRGWEVNWHDAATLDRFLVHGIPLSLRPRAKAEQDILAQTP